MNNETTNRAIGLGLLAVFCVLAIWVWLPDTPTQNAPVSSPERDIGARLEANQDQLAQLIAVTAERPLFDASRQPQTTASQAPPAASLDPLLTLVGVLGVDDDKVALVRVSTSAQLYRLPQGATLGPWQVIQIDTSAITVSKDGGPPQTLVIDR